MTAEEFERLPDTEDVAYELDEGELIERPSRSMIHNFIRGKTEGLIGNHLREHPEQGIVVAEEKFRLADGTIRQPDLALVGKDQIPSIAWEPNIQPFAPSWRSRSVRQQIHFEIWSARFGSILTGASSQSGSS